MPAPKTFVANLSTDLHDTATTARKVERLAKKPPAAALSAHLASSGFKPVTRGKDAFFGATNKFKSNDGKTATFEIVVQSYAHTSSKDVAALATVTFTSGENSKSYHFALVAPKGDFESAIEHTVDRSNKVVRAHSWYTRWKQCLRGRCASACLGALVTCAGTWAAYFWCVVGACGGCVLRCAGCASCDCRFWCRWGVGCCEG